MLVCVCNGVSDKDIDTLIHEGVCSSEEIRGSLGIGNCCGQCATYAKDLINEKITSTQTVTAKQIAYEIRL